MKKYIVSSDALRPALKRLGHAFAENNNLPELTNIVMEFSGQVVNMTTSNLELTVIVTLPVESEKKSDETFLLPYKFLSDIIGVIGSVPVVIEYHNQKKVIIRGENDVYELNSLDKVEKYPNIPVLPKKNCIKPTGDFVKLLHDSMHTASNDDLRPAMTCACLDMKVKEPVIVTTDAYSLYLHKIVVDKKEDMQLLFPRKLVSAADGLSDVEVSWTEKHVAIRSANTSLISKKMDAPYPNYNVVINQSPASVKLNASQLAEALKKSLVIKDGSSRTTLHFSDESTLRFDAIDVDTERKANISMPFQKLEGPVEDITINAKKLLTILKQIVVDEICLHITGKNKGIIITGSENKNYLGMLMPITD